MAQDIFVNEEILLQVTPSTVVDWSGGEGVAIMEGTFNGATLTLEIQAVVGAGFVAHGTSATLTADGSIGFTAPAGCQLRIKASVADPTSVFVSIMPV